MALKPVMLTRLPSIKYHQGEELTPDKLQQNHIANMQDSQAIADAVNVSTPFHLGEIGVDFQSEELSEKYPEGQIFTYTENGEKIWGTLMDGEIYGVPLVRRNP
jgi:hypothetical protein